MQVEGPGHRAKGSSRGIADPHDHAPVKLALCRAVVMDCASQEIPVRTEEPAGVRVFIGKSVIAEDLPFVLINAGNKRCPGRNRFAGELETANLVINDDIVTKVHTTRSALPAGKNHTFVSFATPENIPGTVRYYLQSPVFIRSYARKQLPDFVCRYLRQSL